MEWPNLSYAIRLEQLVEYARNPLSVSQYSSGGTNSTLNVISWTIYHSRKLKNSQL
jgi:hypothetical protein